MPRTCTVCKHEKRADIDLCLVKEETYRHISHRFGVSMDALKRHQQNGHISEVLIKAREIEQIVQGDDLLGQIRYLQAEALNILEDAKTEKDRSGALSAIGRASALIEIQAKLLGKLADVTVKVNVTEVAREAAVWWKGRHPGEFKKYVEYIDKKYSSLRN